jgi:DNA-binding LacI/PurR family transcriptional regulator
MLNRSTVADQAAAYLRDEIKQGRWTGQMPGRSQLAREVGVHGSTVERALLQLEKEGLLEGQGPGKRRRILARKKQVNPRARVCIVLYEPGDTLNDYILELQHHLNASGHSLTFAPQTMRELKFDPARIETMMKKQSADACIIFAGAREVLERVSHLSLPTFALFGRMSGLPIAGAGAEILTPLRETIGRLHELGHRRIVMLSRAELMKSGPGLTERTFLEELKKRGLPHGPYNLPDWENSPAGLRECLGSLFQVTPPTAILLDDWMLFYATQNYLAHEGGEAFHKVTCISKDNHPSMDWCQPGVPHFYWDHLEVVQCAVRWVNNVARGRDDRKQKLIKAELVNADALTKVGD